MTIGATTRATGRRRFALRGSAALVERALFAIALCVTIATATFARTADAAIAILESVVEHETALEKPAPDGTMAPVLTRVRSGRVYAAIEREARSGFTAEMLALDESAQRIAGTSAPQPTWLLLSNDEGGYARRGFWLREGAHDRFVGDPFVDLVVDEASIESGEFEEIFAHELGHVFLRRLLPKLPPGSSRTPHGSLAITDYPTAFDEGFAIHFQALARRMTRNAHLRDEDFGLDAKPFVSYWRSNIDRAARIEGVRRNMFAQAQIMMPGDGDPLGRRDQSTLFDSARLKNGNQMLASEGLIATLFYRWLVPGAVDRHALIGRYAYAFAALAAMNRRELKPDSPFFIDLIDAERDLFPDEAKRLDAIFVGTTYGATADTSLPRLTETLAASGRIGDAERFTANLKTSREALANLRASTWTSAPKLRAALGPDIWVLTDVAMPAGEAMSAKTMHRSLNLNTAELEELLTLPELDRQAAERALVSRRRDGPFLDVHDFVARVDVDPAMAGRLEARVDALRTEGTFARR